MCRPLGKRHDLIDRRVLRRRERCDDRRQIDARNDPYFRVVEKVMSNIGRRGADEIREDQDAVVAPKTVDQLGGMRDARIDIVALEETVAVVRVLEEKWGGRIDFTDYLLLLKIDGEWKCVAKAYNQNSDTIQK